MVGQVPERIPLDIHLEGETIDLRRLTEANATQEYCGWLNDREVNAYLVTKKTTIAELKDYIREKNKSQNCVFLGIFYKKNGSHIGNIKLEPIEFDKKTAILGIMIGNKEYWGRGIGSEAIKLLVGWAFNCLKLKKIEAGVLPANSASLKAFQKAGFSIERVEKKSIENEGRMEDKIIMGIENRG